VILSQLIRGLTDGLKGKENVTVQDFAGAWHTAVASAYRAVIKPVEGTMLTVAKSLAREIKEAASLNSNLEKVLEQAIYKGYETLEQTPEMLPVLKKAGLLMPGERSSGYSWGRAECSKQRRLYSTDTSITAFYRNYIITGGQPGTRFDLYVLYRFLLNADSYLETDIKEHLNDLGGSIVTGNAGTFMKIHIHTNKPGMVLEYCQQHGTLHDIKIDNMHDQRDTADVTVDTVDELVRQKRSV